MTISIAPKPFLQDEDVVTELPSSSLKIHFHREIELERWQCRGNQTQNQELWVIESGFQ